MKAFGIVLSIIVGMGLVALIVFGIFAADTKTFDPVHGTDCINVYYKVNHPFSPDKNYSGLYCPAK